MKYTLHFPSQKVRLNNLHSYRSFLIDNTQVIT